jgi:hypothetical protein
MNRSMTTYETMLDRAVRARLHDISRRHLLRNLAVAGGSLALMGPVTIARAKTGTPTGGEAEAPFASEVDVLNYALTLEHLEATFYREALVEFDVDAFTTWGFQPGVYDRLEEIADHEAQHVTTLTGVIDSLGAEPVAEATYEFGYTDARGFIEIALAIEDVGVAAYQGAAQYLIDNDQLLTAALTIHGVEARHAAYLALMNSGNPFPESFNPSMTPEEVLATAGPFITGG